jgi:hypothetical protein
MERGADLLAKARDCKDLAKRARRMAAGLSQDADRTRIGRYADELEARAIELERQAAAAPSVPVPLVTQPQLQAQQQRKAEPAPDPDAPKPKI